jgi:hypothetical protein
VRTQKIGAFIYSIRSSFLNQLIGRVELTRQDNPLVGIFEESRVEALAGFDRLLSQKGSKYKANPPVRGYHNFLQFDWLS